MATKSPSAVPADANERPQATLPTGSDNDDDALITEYSFHDYPNPIDHGVGTISVLNDLNENGSHAESACSRLTRGWRDKFGDSADEPYVLVEDIHTYFDWLHDDYPSYLVLKKKGWKVGRDVDPDLVGPDADTDALIDQLPEYSIQVMRYDEETGALADDLDSNLRVPVSFQCWVQPQNTDLVQKSGDDVVSTTMSPQR